MTSGSSPHVVYEVVVSFFEVVVQAVMPRGWPPVLSFLSRGSCITPMAPYSYAVADRQN